MHILPIPEVKRDKEMLRVLKQEKKGGARLPVPSKVSPKRRTRPCLDFYLLFGERNSLQSVLFLANVEKLKYEALLCFLAERIT